MPISDRASSTLHQAALAELVSRAAVEDHDIGALAARKPRRDRLGRISHRGAARRDQVVPGGALEGRAQFGVGAVKAGGDHHMDIGGRCCAHQEQRGHCNHGYRSNEPRRFHALPPAWILADIVSRQVSILKEGRRPQSEGHLSLTAVYAVR
jgi:hypothetical protein